MRSRTVATTSAAIAGRNAAAAATPALQVPSIQLNAGDSISANATASNASISTASHSIRVPMRLRSLSTASSITVTSPFTSVSMEVPNRMLSMSRLWTSGYVLSRSQFEIV